MADDGLGAGECNNKQKREKSALSWSLHSRKGWGEGKTVNIQIITIIIIIQL